MNCAFLSCAVLGASFGFASAAAEGDYVVVVDRSTQAETAWQPVVGTLKAKHRAAVLVYDGPGNVAGLLSELKRLNPKYVCFVAKPETAGRALVVNAAQTLRKIDDDPYGDALWGIVTGYDAADALRLARTPQVREVNRLATSLGPGALGDMKGGFASDEGNGDDFWLKSESGMAAVKRATDGNPAQALAEAFNTCPIDYFVTSGHASERDWQIVYNRNEGSLRHGPEGELYFEDPSGGKYPMKSPSPKIYLAAGNCLIGDIDRRSCMATAWIHSGGVEQFCGYTCVTFFGFMGWGVKSQLEEARCAFAEACYLQNQMLVWMLTRKGDGKLATVPLVEKDFGGGQDVKAFIQAHTRELIQIENGKTSLDEEALGLLWDRDIVAFYGDPAERVSFPASRKRLQVAVEGDSVEVAFLKDTDFGALGDVKSTRPVITLLDEPPAGAKLLDAVGRPIANAVVNDRFLLIPMTGRHAAGERLRYRLAK